jgi:hypothetical protein
MPRHGTIAIPRLSAPLALRSDSGGGSSGGGDHTTRHIRVTTEVAAPDLLPAYASQLADAGWRLGALQTTPTSAVQWLEANDESGRVWRGLLAVYANGTSLREVFIYVAKDPT